MKTLLQINTVLHSGATGRITEGIGKVAKKEGWRTIIAYGRNQMSSESELLKIGTNWDVRMHGIQTRLFDNHGLASTRSTKAFISKIKKLNPDIIHLHNIHGYYLNYKVLFDFLSESQIPVVWTLHDCWPITGHCTYFDFVNCNKWKTQCYKCPQKNNYPTSILLDNSKRNFLTKEIYFNKPQNLILVPVSNWLKTVVTESFLSKFSQKVIHNGIDLNYFKPSESKSLRQKLNLIKKTIILGVANHWEKRKGLSDFIKMNKILDARYQIILVGLSKRQFKNLPSGIIGIEKTNSLEELTKYYSMADVFINLTYEDNFPTTNLEAMGCGTPVITYNTGGSPEAINNETGFVVEKGDIQALINKIKIIREKGKQNYSLFCRDRAEKFYDKNDCFLDYLNLYNSLLN